MVMIVTMVVMTILHQLLRPAFHQLPCLHRLPVHQVVLLLCPRLTAQDIQKILIMQNMQIPSTLKITPLTTRVQVMQIPSTLKITPLTTRVQTTLKITRLAMRVKVMQIPSTLKITPLATRVQVMQIPSTLKITPLTMQIQSMQGMEILILNLNLPLNLQDMKVMEIAFYLLLIVHSRKPPMEPTSPSRVLQVHTHAVCREPPKGKLTMSPTRSVWR